MATIRLQQNRINPLSLPLILAQELRIFQKNHCSVELQLDDQFVFQGKNAFLNGEIDAQMGDTTFFFYYLKEGKNAVITSTLTRTIQLVGQKNWQALNELTVGISRTGLFRFFVDTYLHEELPPVTYDFINNTYERIQALEDKKIQALVAIEPFVTTVLSLPEQEVIWHSNQLDACFVMWCFDAEFANKYPEDVRNFHRSLEEAQTYFNQQSTEEKVALLIKHCHLPEEKALIFKDFSFEPQKNYAESDFALCQDWMFNNQEIDKKIAPKEGLFQTF